jgi:hypothetical protein
MTMRSKDVHDATQALLNWCDSQEIAPDDAVRVLTTALVAIIHEVAVATGRDAKQGGQIIANIIVEALP